jgi:type IV pilus assembly protein PilA
MKKIQAGFTLIELMIVVAIIGILAAVAIPAYQDYIVKAKLSKVTTTLDPVKTALAMYFQEQGSFPTPAAGDLVLSGTCVAAGGVTCTAGLNPGSQTTTGQFWNSLGFSVVPSLPGEVATMGVVQGATTNIALVLQLKGVKAGTIDGTLLSVSPITGVTPASTTTVSGLTTQSIAGASAMNWYYGCNKGGATAGSTDAVMKNFFKNDGAPITCP